MQSKNTFVSKAKELVGRVNSILDIDSVKSEQERQIYGAFLFGVINGLSYEMKENPINVQGLMIEVLINDLKYSPNQAAEFCQYLIDATDQESNPTVFAIIHRGMDGYYDLLESNNENVESNYREIVQLVAESSGE